MLASARERVPIRCFANTTGSADRESTTCRDNTRDMPDSLVLLLRLQIFSDSNENAILIDVSGTGGYMWEWLSPEMQIFMHLKRLPNNIRQHAVKVRVPGCRGLFNVGRPIPSCVRKIILSGHRKPLAGTGCTA